ncbi:Neural-cadherin [Chionoecetes opilio]|uniref:Neural-cadherin n=1 Tax=Chionoecetes opilio TaxID=41210 RepID=A0A8J4XMN0_CHIOP|nr:Neural-cadherin [Chionoecetes opilio]
MAASPQGCLDDVRVSGRVVPLPPAANSTPWGQATMFQGVKEGCSAPPACANVTCRPPLICVDTWRSYHCGCGTGKVLSGTRDTCEDEDECAWDPCLHGGTCLNKPSGFLCQCASGFPRASLPPAGPADNSPRLSLTAWWPPWLCPSSSCWWLACYSTNTTAVQATQGWAPAGVNGGERTASRPRPNPTPMGPKGQPAWTTGCVRGTGLVG